MSKRIATAVAILGAAGLISGCEIQQPSAGCQVQDSTFGPWQAVYVLKNPADASKSCGNLKGEALGVFKYVDPTKPNSSKLAIRSETAASLTEYSPASGPTVERVDNPAVATSVSGTMADQPDAKGLCAASNFSAAKVDAKEVKNTTTGEVLAPATSVTYAYSDVQVYSAPSAPGTQLQGSLTYSDGSGCTAEYKVLALWPQTPCDPDAFAHPTADNAADRCAEGSGLNPDFDVVCVAGIGPDGAGGCVPNLQTGVPAFKSK